MEAFRHIGPAAAVAVLWSSSALAQTTVVDIEHQAVDIAPFADSEGLTGVQTMTFETKTGGDRLVFPSGPLIISALSLDDAPVEGWSATEAGIEVRPGRALAAGERHSLRLTYRAAPGRGFQRTDGLAWSGYFACDWMLCAQSDFSDRFTMDLTLRTPVGMRTLGPGVEVGAAPEADGEVHRWRTTEAYPAYVHGFVAGRLADHDVSGDCQTRLDVLTTAPVERVRALFGPTCDMLKFFEARSGVALPADRYSQLYLPDRSEAQEAISHSTLGGDAREPLITDPTADWAVAHELAHQWWGNRMTAADLSQFWLNEGIVTFMTAAWKEHRWGRAAYDREIALARGRWDRCRSEWRDVSLTFAGPWPSLGARRCVQYSKAAVFLDDLRGRMGEDAFWNGLAGFTRAHGGRSVTSRDFEAAMQMATPVDLRPLFAEWVDAGPT